MLSNRIYLVFLTGYILTMCGCIHPESTPVVMSPSPPATPQRHPEISWVPGATVVHVDNRYRHVILECVVIPEAGTEAEVYHDGKKTATIMTTDQRQGSYVSAYIAGGQPQAGDPVRYMQITYRDTILQNSD